MTNINQPTNGGKLKKFIKWFTVILFVSLLGVGSIGYYLYHAEDELWQARQEYLEDLNKDGTGNEVLFFLSRVMVNDLIKRTNPYHGKKDLVYLPPRSEAGLQRHKIPLEQLNAYMTIELEKFLGRHLKVSLPKSISGQMIAVNKQNQIELKFKYTNSEIDQVITLVFDFKLDQDGMAVLTCDRVYAGKLPVPKWILVANLKKHIPPKHGLGQLFAEDGEFEKIVFEPVIKLKKDRDQVRVKGAAFAEDHIIVDYIFEKQP